MSQIIIDPPKDELISKVQNDLDEALRGEKRRKYSRFVLAALGSIPWVGGFLSASAAIDAENEQGAVNEIHRKWLEEHQQKLQELGQTLTEVIERLETFGDEIEERVESPEYLQLINKGFRTWDSADSRTKRDLVQKLLTRAGATKLCPDDLVRLFIDWIDHYHEAHFLVIKEIYIKQGITRGEIWDKIHTVRPAENSAEADLFKLLIRDLSTGGVIRQYRPTNHYGQFIKQPSRKKQKKPAGTLKSAFDDTEPYELTQLGSQFVHYTMEEVVTRIEKNE